MYESRHSASRKWGAEDVAYSIQRGAWNLQYPEPTAALALAGTGPAAVGG